MEDKVILLDFWVSPFTMRVKIALAMKGIEYESREEDLGNKNKSHLLLEMNPVNRKVPVLIHNGKPVCESMIIVQYIDEVWTQKSPLLPSHPYQRAQARFWTDYIDEKIFALGTSIFWPSPGESQLEAAKKELMECFKLLEGELGDKPYFGGEGLGFVDVALIPFYSWFGAFEQIGLSIFKECPKIVTWAHRCMEKESVSMFIPDHSKVNDYIAEMKKKFQAQ